MTEKEKLIEFKNRVCKVCIGYHECRYYTDELAHIASCSKYKDEVKENDERTGKDSK